MQEIPRQLPPTVVCLGAAYAGLGRHAEAVSRLEQGAALLASWTATSLLTRELAGAYLAMGQHARAGEIAARGLAVAARQGERGLEAWLLRLLGELAAQSDPPDRESADRQYRQALAGADELGMRPLAAHCHLGLGRLHRQTSGDAAARDHFASAATLYREMDMRLWLEQAEAEMRARAPRSAP
jgi:tetratricopeptide (TPR) repeat protein